PRDANYPPATLATAKRRVELVPDKTQSDVIIGWPGLPRTDPRFTAARVTNMVYAADTFASRAGNVIRDQLGLAYYVFSAIGASSARSRKSRSWRRPARSFHRTATRSLWPDQRSPKRWYDRGFPEGRRGAVRHDKDRGDRDALGERHEAFGPDLDRGGRRRPV